jgi:CubicO group peptidase (beta-lactamase class C family)
MTEPIDKILADAKTDSFCAIGTRYKLKFGSNDLFEIMSISKLFLGIVCGILYDQGKLNIREDISKWFPEYKGIAVCDLLAHTSGIDSKWTSRGDLFKLARGRTIGKKVYQYNNFNAVLLVMIINHIENAAKLYARIFKLLGINKYKLKLRRGIPLGAYGIKLSTADLCKVGAAYQNRSKPKLLSSRWITMAKQNLFLLLPYGNGLYGHDGMYGQYLVFNDNIVFAICRRPNKKYYKLINGVLPFDIKPVIGLLVGKLDRDLM